MAMTGRLQADSIKGSLTTSCHNSGNSNAALVFYRIVQSTIVCVYAPVPI